MLILLLGLSCQVFGQTPAKDFDGSWQGTLEAGGTKLRLALTITKSDAGVYAGKMDSLDQGATIPIDTITVNGDAVRWEIKSPAIVFEGTLNKERTELTGTFAQADQKFPLALKRSEQAAVMPPPKPKPDYSAPPDAPYIAEEVMVKTPAGHTLAGTLTLPKSASRTQPVSAIVTITGSGPRDRGVAHGRPGHGGIGWHVQGLDQRRLRRGRASWPCVSADAARDPGRPPRGARPQRGCSDRANGG